MLLLYSIIINAMKEKKEKNKKEHAEKNTYVFNAIGMQPLVSRNNTEAGDDHPCEFCRARLCSEMTPLDVAPEGILQRHKNCACIIKYVPAKDRGKQVLWIGGKTWNESKVLYDVAPEVLYDAMPAEKRSKELTHILSKQHLSNDEKMAIKDYTTQKIGMKINNNIRDQKTLTEHEKDIIKNLDKIISNYELKCDITIYRGIDNAKFIQDLKQKKINETFGEKAFSSTSILHNSSYVRQNIKGVNINYELIIKVPKGKGRGAYINTYSTKKDNEYEFLLARNTDFKVLEKYDNINIIVLEVMK